MADVPQLPQEEETANNPDRETPTYFPPKPIPQPNGSRTISSLISMALYVAALYFVFKFDLQFIALLTGILLIHELGHYLAMKIFGYEDLSIFFIPLVGAAASGRKDAPSQWQRSVVLLAGPVPGILIGATMYFLSPYIDSPNLLRTAYAFILLNVVNLAPVYPLDGGQLLKTLFMNARSFIADIFMFLSVALFGWFAIRNQAWYLLIIPYFLLSRYFQQLRLRALRRDAAAEGVNINQTFAEMSDRDYWLLRDILGQRVPPYTRIITPGEYEELPQENSIISYIRALLQKDPARDLSFIGILLLLLVWAGAIGLSVYIGLPLVEHYLQGFSR
jgi:stage IV sporulation protein FB